MQVRVQAGPAAVPSVKLPHRVATARSMLTAEYTSKFAAGFTAKFTAEFTSVAVAATGHTTPA